MSRNVVAFVTPGAFAIPSARSSSVEIVVDQLARRLTGQLQVHVFGKQGKLAREEWRDGIHYIRVPAPNPSAYLRAVSGKLRRLAPGLIQVDNRPKFILYLRRRHPRATIWLMLHSLTFLSPAMIRRETLKRCLAAADRIIVNSSFMRNQVARLVPQSAHKLAVNHLGVNPDQFHPHWTPPGGELREEMRSRYGLAGKKVILFAGRLIPIKGVHKLLKAMEMIVRQVPDSVLVIVGSAFYGSHRTTPYVRRLYRIGRRLPRHVLFVPYVPHGQMFRWYAAADCMVVPSGAKEAFGLVNVEAMASGLPVIATRAGGMPEIIEDGVTGYLIDPARTEKELATRVTHLLSNPELAGQMGRAGWLRVWEQFTWDHTASRWLEQLALY